VFPEIFKPVFILPSVNNKGEPNKDNHIAGKSVFISAFIEFCAIFPLIKALSRFEL
jgi:hypothetical protein